MASKKDMRRADFIIPYIEPAPDSKEGEMASTMSSTMPMAAMVTRNRMIAWVSVVFALQTWLAETPASRKRNGGNPAYFSVLMAIMALAVSLMGFFLPPQAPKTSSSTGAPPPQAAQ